MSRLEHNLMSVSRTCPMNDFGMLSEFDERFVRMMCLCMHIEIERIVLQAVFDNKMVTNSMRAAM